MIPVQTWNTTFNSNQHNASPLAQIAHQVLKQREWNEKAVFRFGATRTRRCQFFSAAIFSVKIKRQRFKKYLPHRDTFAGNKQSFSTLNLSPVWCDVFSWHPSPTTHKECCFSSLWCITSVHTMMWGLFFMTGCHLTTLHWQLRNTQFRRKMQSARGNNYLLVRTHWKHGNRKCDVYTQTQTKTPALHREYVTRCSGQL